MPDYKLQDHRENESIPQELTLLYTANTTREIRGKLHIEKINTHIIQSPILPYFPRGRRSRGRSK